MLRNVFCTNYFEIEMYRFLICIVWYDVIESLFSKCLFLQLYGKMRRQPYWRLLLPWETHVCGFNNDSPYGWQFYNLKIYSSWDGDGRILDCLFTIGNGFRTHQILRPIEAEPMCMPNTTNETRGIDFILNLNGSCHEIGGKVAQIFEEVWRKILEKNKKWRVIGF